MLRCGESAPSVHRIIRLSDYRIIGSSAPPTIRSSDHRIIAALLTCNRQTPSDRPVSAVRSPSPGLSAKPIPTASIDATQTLAPPYGPFRVDPAVARRAPHRPGLAQLMHPVLRKEQSLGFRMTISVGVKRRRVRYEAMARGSAPRAPSITALRQFSRENGG